MGITIVLGYLAAVVIGVTLGLLGSGGSILTVPALVYLFHIPAALATTYSLFVVGFGAAVGAGDYARKDLVDWRTLLAFGLPSSVGMFLTRGLLVPVLPEVLYESGSLKIERDHAMIVLFAFLMLWAAIAMLRPAKEGPAKPVQRRLVLAGYGVCVGALMGLVGAGGGFLIVPALTTLAKLDMRRAAGTSLAVIAMNSLLGFAGAATRQVIEWPLVLGVAALTAAGIGLGSWLAGRIETDRLKRGFGFFVLVMALFILGKELLLV